MVELKPASSNNTESDQSSRQTDFTIADEKTKKKNATANEHHASPDQPASAPQERPSAEEEATCPGRPPCLRGCRLPICCCLRWVMEG